MANEDKGREYAEQLLNEMYARGIKVGTLAVCKTILDKLNNTSKTFVNRINDVKKFCEKPLKEFERIADEMKTEKGDEPETVDGIESTEGGEES